MGMSIIFSVLLACQLVCGTVQLDRGHDNNDVLLQYGYSKIDINYKTHYFEEQVRCDHPAQARAHHHAPPPPQGQGQSSFRSCRPWQRPGTRQQWCLGDLAVDEFGPVY